MTEPTPTPALHCIIPWASARSDAAQATLRRLHLPRLEALLARLQPGAWIEGDEFSPATPHETALARALGLPDTPGATPWAARQAVQQGLPNAHAQAWAWITPCHFIVGADQVQMAHAPTLDLSADESEALRQVLQDFFKDDGIVLHPDQPMRWLAQGDFFRDLPSASLERVMGRNVTPWHPSSPQARPLRRLQSETQMLLYTHPLTDERNARGLAAVNGFWVSGSGALPSGWAAPAHEPQQVDALTAPALQEDWNAWQHAWHTLDAGPLSQLLAAHQAGRPVRLTLCGERHARTFESRPRSLLTRVKGLWQRPSAAVVLEAL